MSSYNSATSDNINEINLREYNEANDLLNQGIEKIYNSFKINNKRYNDKISEQKNIISDLTKKIETLSKELEMIQRENQYYKTQSKQHKKEMERLNKTVHNIKGKLTRVDYQINECMKDENIKILNFKKNFDIHNDLKNNNIGQSSLQFNPKIILKEDKNGKNKGKMNKSNKAIVKKNLLFCMNNLDSKILKENGSENNYDDNSDDIKQSFNNTVQLNSFDLKFNSNQNYKKSQNVLIFNDSAKTGDDNKRKRNYSMNKLNEVPLKDGIYSHKCKKSRSFSNKQFIKDNENNLILYNNIPNDDIGVNNYDNNDDLNINKIISNDKGYERHICYTYDNLLNKKKSDKKNLYNSFRAKNVNNNISEYNYKNYNLKKQNVKKESLFDIIRNFDNEENYKKKKSDEFTYFLKQCKILLQKDSFEAIVKLFQEYKDGLITDEGIVTKTQNLLENNTELVNLFTKVFSK
jgi:uncharacterized protein YukE